MVSIYSDSQTQLYPRAKLPRWRCLGNINYTTLLHFGVGRQDCTSQRQKRGYFFYFSYLVHFLCSDKCEEQHMWKELWYGMCNMVNRHFFFLSKAKQQCASLVRRDTRTGVPASASGPGCGVSVFSCVHLQRSCAPSSPFPRVSLFCSPTELNNVFKVNCFLHYL